MVIKYKAVDFDGTLAEYDGDYASGRAGRPIPLMLNRVKRWLAQGIPVKIVTARVASTNPTALRNRYIINKWLKMFLGVELPITSEKEPLMDELYDDKARQVIPNTGIIVGESNSPTEDLMNEHGVVRRLLAIYQARLDRINETIPVEVLKEATIIFRAFLNNYHEELEEKYIFPRMQNVDTLIEQHHVGRQLIGILLQLLDGEDIDDEILRDLIRMYSRHANYEDTILFPEFKTMVSSVERAQLGEIFERSEEDKFGKNGFEVIVKKIDVLEQQLGINGLASFTARIS